MTKRLREYRSARPTAATLLIVPAAVSIAAALVTLKFLWHDAPALMLPLPPGELTDHVTRWLAGLASLLTRDRVGSDYWNAYVLWLQQIEPAILRRALYARCLLSCISGMGAGLLTFRLLWNSVPDDQPRRGRPLRRGPSAIRLLAAAAAREWKGSQPGIRLHPQVQISQVRETKHLLVMGASGSGKSNIIWQIVNEAIARKDRVLIFDSKGDFTSELNHLCLLAPWDSRSRAWDVAADCPGPLDARELAARMIPDNDKDPMWPNASRAVLVTLLLHLQKTKPLNWTFEDLRQLLNLPIEEIRLLAQQYSPEAVRSLEEGSKTTQSILINLNAFMTAVVDLASAWGSADMKRFSMRRWLEGDPARGRIVVMQGSQQYAQTAAATINSLLSVVAATIASPTLPDDPNRRIWLILDEFAQLGKVRDIGTLIRMGRSKGLRIVIGAQDVAELSAIYGTQRVNAWTSSLTTSIYSRLEGGETAEWVSKRIGDEETEELTQSTTETPNGNSQTMQSAIRKAATVLPSQLKTLAGTRAEGIDAFIDGFDDAVYLVRYPYHRSAPIRAAVRLAAWVHPATDSNEPAAQAAGSSKLNEHGGAIPGNPNRTDHQPSVGDTVDPPTGPAAASGPRTRRWTKRKRTERPGEAQ